MDIISSIFVAFEKVVKHYDLGKEYIIGMGSYLQMQLKS